VRRLLASGILTCAVALSWPAAPAQQAEPEEPRQTDLVETTERRLVQLDVTVRGPREAIADLDSEDFELVVGFSKVTDFFVDNLCELPDEDRVQEVEVVVEEPIEPQPVEPPRPRTNFLFYFDQHHLTMAGRARSIDVAHQLIPELIVGSNRGMIVSAGQELRTFSELTDDPAQLAQALRALNADHRQWDPWVQQEDTRIEEILEILNDRPYDFSRAQSVARGHQREERWRTQKALHLFSMVLGHMSELEPPKAVVYFADTMRANAGDHYLSFFSRHTEGTEGDVSRLHTFTSKHAFDRVLEEATALGIRLFTIEARGLTSPPTRSISAETPAGMASPVANTRPVKDAQDSLVGMALESGGRSFLNGVRARKIAATIKEDLSCVYLLSFDAAHLRKNTTHRVVVRVDQPGVKTHARGQLTVQSESRMLTSRLMAAFASPQNLQSQLPVTSILIPTGFEKGKYAALVQLHVPGSPLPTTSWDMGLSLISRGEVAEDTSGHIGVSGPGVPVVLETEMKFRPGPFKLVGVAHETTGNDVGTGEVEADWPDPDDAEVTLGPVAVMQPTSAAILRDVELRREGAVGVADGRLARTDRPTALVGIVCRAKGSKRKLRVERRLVGEVGSFAPFGSLELDFGDDRCAQIRDLIPAGSMSSGMFSYEIHVFHKKEELASTVKEFAAASPDEHPSLADPSGT
jgi:VWFA-related protein